MATKAKIGGIFRGLDKYGYKVKSFGDNRSLRKGQSGWIDVVIYNYKYFICIEIKTTDTKDKFSDEQKETAKMLSSIMAINKTFYYQVIRTEKEANNYFDRILAQDL
uniref:VRR-NUC domain-containing protein n=1 Tax=viral metagenome TaxID=1070528 RepID=A0A6H2A2P8_9ZZZZ